MLFCCENNLYAMGTALQRSQADVDLTARAETYGMPATTIDGMDVTAVAEAAGDAVAGMRAERGPRFLELRTYRFRAHSMYDPELYRDKDEVATWRDRDPIQLLVRRLRSDGRLDEAALEAIEHDVRADIDDAVAFGLRSPLEPVEHLLRHVYAEETI